jgi:hypothetical protein
MNYLTRQRMHSGLGPAMAILKIKSRLTPNVLGLVILTTRSANLRNTPPRSGTGLNGRSGPLAGTVRNAAKAFKTARLTQSGKL